MSGEEVDERNLGVWNRGGGGGGGGGRSGGRFWLGGGRDGGWRRRRERGMLEGNVVFQSASLSDRRGQTIISAR